MTTIDRLELDTPEWPTKLRVRARHRLRSVDLWLATVLALFGSTLVAYGIGRFPSVGGDEGIYSEQAWAVVHGNITPYTYTYDHPFFGWVQLSVPGAIAQFFHIGGQLSVVNDRAVMVLYAFGSLMLVYGIARRMGMHRVFATLAVVSIAASPLWIVQSRQVLLDNFAIFWVLVALWLLLTPTRRQWIYALAGIAFAVAVLSKETVLLFLPGMLYVLWRQAYKPIRVMSFIAFTSLGTLIVLIYPLFAALRWELLPGTRHVSLWTNGIAFQLASRVNDGALWKIHSIKYDLFDGWMQTDHYLFFGGAIAAGLCFFVTRLRPLGVFMLLWAVPVIKPSGYMPAMYIIAALPFAGLALGGIGDAIFNGVRVFGIRRNARRMPKLQLRTGVAIFVAGTVAAMFAVPAGFAYQRHMAAINVNDVAAGTQAMAWVDHNVPKTDTVLIDDAYFVDMEHDGFGSAWNHVSYYKFDLDPSARTNVGDWHEVDYVITTQEMRSLAGSALYPETGAAIAHGHVVASYGTGNNEIQVLKVTS